MKRIGLVGARGYVGMEFLRLIAAHPQLELAFAVSRELAGQSVREQVPALEAEVAFTQMDAAAVAAACADVVVLALPNGASAEYVKALDAHAADTLVIDLSADYRFDPGWYYGLPELTRERWRGGRRIANPGCYATAVQLAVAPLKDLLTGPPVCFGVSGYSGAGTTPSARNDPALLRDNLMPYALTDHMHERECSYQLGLPVEFMPHVAPHFRGLSVTCNLYLDRPRKRDELQARYSERYAGEPLVKVVDEAPWVSRLAGQAHAEIGGLTVAPGGRRAVVVACLDNLLKGAATQALQNINRALGLNETAGITLS